MVIIFVIELVHELQEWTGNGVDLVKLHAGFTGLIHSFPCLLFHLSVLILKDSIERFEWVSILLERNSVHGLEKPCLPDFRIFDTIIEANIREHLPTVVQKPAWLLAYESHIAKSVTLTTRAFTALLLSLPLLPLMNQLSVVLLREVIKKVLDIAV